MLCMFNFLIVVYVPFSAFCVLFVCKCVLCCCHRMSIQLRLNMYVNMSIFSKIMRENVSTECTYVLWLTRFQPCEILKWRAVPCGMKAQCKKGGRRTLLGNNTGGGAVTLPLIRSRPSFLLTHCWPHVHSIPTCAVSSETTCCVNRRVVFVPSQYAD
jgi:hypothetical protein